MRLSGAQGLGLRLQSLYGKMGEAADPCINLHMNSVQLGYKG